MPLLSKKRQLREIDMADFDNTNSGALFKNDRKTADTHADWNGSVNVEGVEYWVNGWVKEKKSDGSKFFSLSLKPKERTSTATPVRAAPRPKPVVMEDEIPF